MTTFLPPRGEREGRGGLGQCYRTSSYSGCLSLNSWPTIISAVSISMPKARSLAYSLTNDAESGSPASISMVSSSLEGACVLSELRVLGLYQYIISPFPKPSYPKRRALIWAQMVLLPCLLWSSSAVKDIRRTPPPGTVVQGPRWRQGGGCA